MSCHGSPAGSAFTSYAYFAMAREVSDSTVNSLFHELQRRYNATEESERRVYTDADYQELIERQLTRVRNMPDISDARRQSMLRRLEAARTAEVPNQAMLYALHNLTPTVRTRKTNINAFCEQVAARTGVPYAQVRTEFTELSQVTRSRTDGAPETYTADNRELASRHGLAGNAGSVHAVAVLEQRARAVEASRIATDAPARVVRTAVPDDQQSTGLDGLSITEVGYDPRNNRLEMTVHDASTGAVTTHAYTNIPEYLIRYVDPSVNAYRGTQTVGEYWARNIRGNTHYAYPSAEAEQAAGRAPRCTTCGQFAALGHACPMPAEPTVFGSRGGRYVRTSNQRFSFETTAPDGTTSTREAQLHLPLVRDIRTAWAAGPVQVEDVHFSTYDPNNRWVTVTGSITAFADPTDGSFRANTSQLRCNCDAYRANGDCPHLAIPAAGLRTRLEPAPRTPARARTPEERERLLREAQERAEAAAASDWTRAEATLAEARATWRRDAEVLYSEDAAAFTTDYAEALAARLANDDKPVIPFARENALGGFATRGSGQAFGMEIEYEFPESMSYSERDAANRAIGEALHAAGLTSTREQQGYGASKRRPFVDTHKDRAGTGTWSFERDGSVNGGELVTPGMYDEPETWTNLETAVRILREHGAVPSKRAGAHVHVGTGFYQGDPAKYAELGRLVTQHEDVLFRLASDPARGTHRGQGYTAPNPEVPQTGFSNVADVRRWQRGRASALNYANVSGEAGDHPEFRLFDSTLDPGAMQAQIKLAVAMTHAAARQAEAGGTKRGKEELGAHAARAGRRKRRTAEEENALTATARSLLDTLFTRRADKKQLVAVLANTSWNKPKRR